MGDREYIDGYIINNVNCTARKLLSKDEIPSMIVTLKGEDYLYSGLHIEKHYLVSHTYAEYHKVIK